MSNTKTDRVKGRLEQSNSKLSTLLKVTNIINDNTSKKELFGLLRNVLTKELSIGKFVLLVKELNNWETALLEGINKEDLPNINYKDTLSRYTTISGLNYAEDDTLALFDIIIPVFNKERPLAYLLLGDFEDEKIEISPIIKHLRFIQTLVNIIVVALENKRLNREYIKQAAVKKELELAQNMQSLLFPRNLPSNKKLSVKTYYQPHSEIGGDYYDVVELKSGQTAICIADVSGKGVSAALLMANFQANLRALLNVANNLEELASSLNEKVIESANFEKFVTFFIAIFNPQKKKLSCLNAGHQPALLLQNNTVQLLKKGCTVLGMFETLPQVETEEIQLSPNAKLLCFTDGLVELQDENREDLESEGIIKLIKDKQSLEEINNSLLAEIKRRNKSFSSTDDITFLSAEFLQ
jgi:sigma-B regulation protein RsbU (phosphoserine phosphatase)